MLRAILFSPLLLACASAAASPPVGAASATVANAPSAPAVRALPAGQDRDDRRKDLRRQAHDAVDSGNLKRLRVLVSQLEELEIEPTIQDARQRLRLGEAQAALRLVKGALELAPEGPTALMLHGDACFEVGREPYDPALLAGGLDSYLRASASPPRWLDGDDQREFRAQALRGAARTASALGQREEALAHARACLELVRLVGWGTGVRNRLGEWPEKLVFDMAFDLYVWVRSADPARAAELVEEMEAVLALPLARNKDEVWPFTSIASLYLGEGRFGDARRTVLSGLERHPGDDTLPGQLTEAARAIGGSDEVFASMAVLKERAPATALPWWYTARERFDGALARLGQVPAAEFEAAEAEFRRCRELEPNYDELCLQREALCRTAVGWTHLEAGELELARAAFHSAEGLYAGAVEEEVRSVLPSGLSGLEQVARVLLERDDQRAAAGVYQELFEYEPTRLDYAVHAGQVHRAAAERTLVEADAAKRRSKAPLRDPEAALGLLRSAGVPPPAPGDSAAWEAALARADVELTNQARRSLEASYAAYRAAAELAPDDLVVLTDAAALPVHHRDSLDDGLAWAHATLLRCVDLGREELARTDLDEERRLALRQAWGDAHQALGLYHLEHERDLERARDYFRESLAIGPYPRPVVEQDYLPRCSPDGSRDPR